MQDATDQTTREIDWTKFLGGLNKVDAETFNAYFPGKQAQEIKRVARLMTQLAKPATGTSRMAMMIGQMGVIVGTLAGQIPPRADVIVLTPQILSRIFSSEVGLRWLSTGLEAKPWSVVATRSAAALSALLYQESLRQHQEQAQKAAQ